MRAVVCALLVMALLHAFKPYYSDAPAADQTAIDALALKATTLSAQEVVQKITNSKQPTMLVVYASWCSYCRKAMPHIYELWQEKKLDHAQLLLVSVDSNLGTLAEYLLASGLDGMIAAPLVLEQNNSMLLSSVLQPMGARYSGGIPYIGFFTADGTYVSDILGAGSKERIADALVELR